MDVGPVLFDRATERDVSIHNKGRVQFSFEVDTSELSRPSVCDVTPKTGTVLPGQHALVKLKVSHISDTLLWRVEYVLMSSSPCIYSEMLLCTLLGMKGFAFLPTWCNSTYHSLMRLLSDCCVVLGSTGLSAQLHMVTGGGRNA